MTKKKPVKNASPQKSKQVKRKTKTIPAKKRPDKSSGSSILKSIIGFLLLIAIVFTTFFMVHIVFPPEKSENALSDYKQFEVFPKGVDNHPAEINPQPVISSKLPEIAIIIDDVGYNRKIATKFADLNSNITFSVLPNSPHKKSIAVNAHRKGLEIMLHLPMEPFEYPKVNPGPGALLVSMTPNELKTQLRKDISAVPFVKGVNNHMGSRMTSLSSKMYQIFTILKEEDLFFIDSRTAPQSLCKPSARLLQIPFAERNIFLDHFQTPEAVNRQINALIRRALKNGRAIGIGHPHKITFEVLKERLPEITSKVKIVHASKLVRTLG